MMKTERLYQKELLDSDDIPFEDIKQNLKELNLINKWLGGHSITIDGVKELINGRSEVSVCEIGCGGGDNIAAILKWAKRKQIKVAASGIDIKHECIDYALSKPELRDVSFINSDYRAVCFEEKPDIVFSSLFCHHFTNEELVKQFRWMKENSKCGFFINDLQRNTIAYYSIKLLTRLFSRSYLVINDAPLSVARGFKRNELENLVKKAGITKAGIYWKWAFRYLVVYKHE